MKASLISIGRELAAAIVVAAFGLAAGAAIGQWWFS